MALACSTVIPHVEQPSKRRCSCNFGARVFDRRSGDTGPDVYVSFVQNEGKHANRGGPPSMTARPRAALALGPPVSPGRSIGSRPPQRPLASPTTLRRSRHPHCPITFTEGASIRPLAPGHDRYTLSQRDPGWHARISKRFACARICEGEREFPVSERAHDAGPGLDRSEMPAVQILVSTGARRSAGDRSRKTSSDTSLSAPVLPATGGLHDLGRSPKAEHAPQTLPPCPRRAPVRPAAILDEQRGAGAGADAPAAVE